MINQKEQIPSNSLMFAVATFIFGSSLFYGCIAGVTKQDTWIAVIISAIISFPIVWIFATLCEKFPGKTIIEINDIVLGKVIGRIISLLYIFFFFTITFLNCSFTSDFVASISLPETPEVVILIMLIIACVYAIRKGPETMTRYSMILFSIASGALILAVLALINKSHISNLQPVLSLPFMNYVQSTHQITMMSFSNIIVFTMLFPSLKAPQNIKKPVFLGLIIGAIFMFGVVFIDILALGPLESMVALPSFDVIRIIDVDNVVTRMDFLFEAAFIILFFFKISICLYATIKGIAQVLNLQKYKFLVPVIAALTICFALSTFDSSEQSTYIAATILPIYQTLFELILPAITLIAASIRGFRKPKAVDL